MCTFTFVFQITFSLTLKPYHSSNIFNRVLQIIYTSFKLNLKAFKPSTSPYTIKPMTPIEKQTPQPLKISITVN